MLPDDNAQASPGVTHRVAIEPNFESWRDAARRLIAANISPDQVEFIDTSTQEPSLFAQRSPDDIWSIPTENLKPRPHVPRQFLASAQAAAAHRDPARWSLLYRLLWRLQRDRNLLQNDVDGDVVAFNRIEQQVAKDLYKMQESVRFQRVEEEGGEHYIAWYKPENDILHLAAPFFAEKFAGIRWSILTPDASVHWNPRERLLKYGPGVPREHAPQEDEWETLWKSYSASIVNPARIDPRPMKAGEPVKYGGTPPEIDWLPQLLDKSDARIEGVMAKEKTSAAPFVPERHSIAILKQAVQKCRGCDLYKFATQAVFGDGPAHAAMMLVGEQPGDEEDKRGAPFVGPAGRVLSEMLEEVGIERKEVYVTNAVKHFKFVERGKRRLHQPPRLSEIVACKPWLEAEFDAIKPRVVVCLGATAAKSVLGSKFALMKERGKVIESTSFKNVIATIHPSAVLRAPDDEMRHQLRTFLKHDLTLAMRTALSRAS